MAVPWWVAEFAVKVTKLAHLPAVTESPTATLASAACPYPAVVPPVAQTVFNVPLEVVGSPPTKVL